MVKKEKQQQEFKELLQKVQADFENYKKRTEQEKIACIEYASRNIIEKLLPILDNFELALKHTSNKEEFVKGSQKSDISGTHKSADNALLQGVELIYSQVWDILEKEGLSPIESVDQKFNPYLHEALLQEESDKEDGTILEELQKGYMLKENVLRHAKVKIAKKKNKDIPEKKTTEDENSHNKENTAK